MSLLFGNLTQDFVKFGTTVMQASSGDQDAIDKLPSVAAGFRKTAALDASYLVYIGRLCSLRNLTTNELDVRRRYVRMHISLYVYLGIHRRSQCETRSGEISQGRFTSGYPVLR